MCIQETFLCNKLRKSPCPRLGWLSRALWRPLRSVLLPPFALVCANQVLPPYTVQQRSDSDWRQWSSDEWLEVESLKKPFVVRHREWRLTCCDFAHWAQSANSGSQRMALVAPLSTSNWRLCNLYSSPNLPNQSDVGSFLGSIVGILGNSVCCPPWRSALPPCLAEPPQPPCQWPSVLCGRDPNSSFAWCQVILQYTIGSPYCRRKRLRLYWTPRQRCELWVHPKKRPKQRWKEFFWCTLIRAFSNVGSLFGAVHPLYDLLATQLPLPLIWSSAKVRHGADQFLLMHERGCWRIERIGKTIFHPFQFSCSHSQSRTADGSSCYKVSAFGWFLRPDSRKGWWSGSHGTASSRLSGDF
jgi:hypothetical protein